MNFFKKNFLLLIVFVTGAAVLIIEVTATRILAPYFGNTLFSISSILGVILGALSIGYYLGGISADRRPEFSIFFFLVFLAGIFSFLIQPLSRIILDSFGYSLDIKTGPLVTSLVLFFVPSLILGMMSPFAIKLKSMESKEIGRVSGSVFFWSTLGSIVGSFAAGFLLIPNFGVGAIIMVTGSLLAVIGIVGYGFSKQGKKYPADLKLFLLLFFIFPLGLSLFLFPSEKSVIFQKDGLYGRIKIEEITWAGQRARVLRLDKGLEGGILLESDELPFQYTRYYALYGVFNPQAETALFLGGGPYSVPRSLLSEHNNIKKVDVAEIEPELYQLAKKYFDLPEDPRLSNYIVDGRRFLAKTDNKYDIIFADAYHALYAIPVHLATQEFFTLAKDKLSDNGFLLMNVIGTLENGSNSLLLAELKTFKSVFKSSYLFAVESPDKSGPQNFILLGFKDDLRAVDFEDSKFAQSDKGIIRNLPEKLVSQETNLDSVPLLTDDFAPIEYLVSKVF